ncbi:hypothetical protein R50073_03370 [Maricurvus nonylphenolicus]|uniref:N-acetylglucosaminyltransferase n=1 Tax=Maricurvus nonylphenolicus TaxID=1008307 RepID=UPI0036F2D999
MRLIVRLLVFAGALLLLGCVSEPAKPTRQPVTVVDPEVSRQAAIDNLLRRAEQALQADRLASPAHDNAADRYRAVLKLDPQNAQAKTGLQLVVMRYVDLGRNALAKSRIEQADYFLARARGVGGVPANNSLLTDLQRNIVTAKVAKAAEAADQKRFELDEDLLTRKAPELEVMLSDIAQRVRETDESLLIVARTDAEGRWLYQQMRRAVPGYRLRGNIKIGKRPHISLQAPID